MTYPNFNAELSEISASSIDIISSDSSDSEEDFEAFLLVLNVCRLYRKNDVAFITVQAQSLEGGKIKTAADMKGCSLLIEITFVEHCVILAAAPFSPMKNLGGGTAFRVAFNCEMVCLVG